MQRVATHLISNRIYEVDTHTERERLHVAISVALAAAPAQSKSLVTKGNFQRSVESDAT